MSLFFNRETVNATPIQTEIPALVAPPLSTQRALEQLASVPKEEEAVEAPVIAKTPSVQCECVRWIREVLGYPIRGNSWEITPNTGKIAPNIAILFTYGHAGLITRVEGSKIYFKDTNRNKDCVVRNGVVDLSDIKQSKKVKGFFDGYRAIELAQKQSLIEKKR